jgi:cytochrome b6-f complex subunit 5
LQRSPVCCIVLIDVYGAVGALRGKGIMIEPLLLGIVLGLIAVTLGGLFFAAYLQYRRGNQFNL